MNGITAIILQIISNIPVDILSIYCWKQCSQKTIIISRKKIILMALFMTVVTACLNFSVDKSARIFLIFAFLIALHYLLVSKKLYKSVIAVLILEAILWLTEFSFVVIFSPFISDILEFLYSVKGFVIINLYICIVLYILIKLRIPQKSYIAINNLLKTARKNEALLYLLMIILTIIISTIEGHLHLSFPTILTTNTIMGIIFIGIILKFTTIKVNYNKINNKYQTSITSLKEYETMIDKYRVNNHENKNELMTIRNMIMTKDKATLAYIDKLVDNKTKDNERIMYKTSKIPEGGLRATIYSKLTLMDKYKIKYTLDIANDVRTADLINLGDETILNICKILGVFLDNAIDAVKNLRKKNINVEFYIMDGYLNIDITNNFKGELDLNKIGTKRYTTKGDGHGYGLSLVEQIISENSEVLENEKRVNGDTFTQTLKIKM